MKRFFTFLMAILALLSISQTVKAANVTVYFQCPSDWATPVHAYVYNQSSHFTEWSATDECTKVYTSKGVELWKYSFDSKFTKVIFQDGNRTVQTTADGFDVTDDNLVYTSGGPDVTLSVFETKAPYTYTLRGGYGDGAWNNESSNFEYDGVGKYTYTFTAAQDGEFRFRVNTSYTSGAALCPNVDGNTKRKELTSTPEDVAYNDQKDASVRPMSDNYWFCSVTNGKKYTFTLTEKYNSTDNSYTRKLSVVPEEAVVTKVIKLWNGTSELTGSNGKYTLDLSGETSSDANITLTIDGTKYGLATAQTISAVGKTNVDFVANATAPLTLTKGFIYSLSVKEDGKMTVVAKEKGVANGNYYLVGNFFNGETEINYDKKYFRFTDNGDGTLYFDIPATLSVNAQILASDGTCYGPVNGESGYGISNTHPSADEVFVEGNLVAGKNYWKFADRLLTGDGIYKVTIKVDETGVPTSWKIDFDKTQRMAYFLEDPEETTDAVAHPCYAKKNVDGSCDNKFFGNIYLEAKQHCYVIGNIRVDWENKGVNLLKTNQKLYLQGNGGRDVTTNTGGTSDGWKYTNVFPNQKGFYFPKDQSLYLEYNPSAGHQTASTVVDGIAGEVKPASGNFETPITSIWIVGDGVVGSWDLEKATKMTYNKTLDCWECTITTTKSESADNKFRFIANKDWKYNWGEESKKPEDQARTPHYLVDDEHLGHVASITDPNNLSLTTDGKGGSEANRNGSGTFGDIIFNRPAGEWTIRFYSRAVSNGNDYIKAYGYTITDREHTGIPLTYCAGKFIRTYSNDVAMDIIDPRVKVYEAYRYTMPQKVENNYSQGTLELRELKYIPANMGVVLIGTVPATETHHDGETLNFSISKRTDASAKEDKEYVNVWTKAADYKDQPWNNFLVPTVKAVPNLGNAATDANGNITYRYFCLNNYHDTNFYKEHKTGEDYIGFFRLTENGRSGANKAYLSLPTREDLPGGKFGFINYNGQFIGTGETSLAKMMLIFDDETSGVTEIKNVEVNKQNNDNAYYTLQGIKVLKPTKGIFIHNGKKIVIK